jgi:nitrogen fixation NifU-like protein
VGTIDNADGFGKSSGGPNCPEDVAHFWIRVAGDRIVDVRQRTHGCPVAIAASSVTSVLALGKTLDEAERITAERVLNELGDLPARKVDSIVGTDALHAAIADYREHQR